MKRLFTLTAFCLLTVAFNNYVFAQAGTPDAGFGKNGRALDSTGSNGMRFGLQSDNKIVYATTDYIGFSSLTLLNRLNADGTPDTTFGVHGQVKDYNISAPYIFTILPNNKIMIGGSPSTNFDIYQYTADGILDTNFNNHIYIYSGHNYYSFNSHTGISTPTSALLLPGGKFIIGGTYYNFATSNSDFAFMRLTASGKLDSAFATNGVLVVPMNPTASDQVKKLLLDGNGKIVALGDDGNDIQIARIDSTGKLDVAFNDSGKVQADFGNGTTDVFTDALIQNGKIIVSCSVFDFYGTTGADIDLMRFNSNGKTDNTFGANGRLSKDFNKVDQTIYGMVEQPDGKVILATTSGEDTTIFKTIRYNADFTPDNPFGTGGVIDENFNFTNNYAQGVAITTDGKLIVGGMADSGNVRHVGFVKYLLGTISATQNINRPVNSFSVYPNPATTMIYITGQLFKTGDVVSIVNVTGSEVARQEVSNSVRLLKINTQNLTNGVYFVHITGSAESAVQKIVISK